jgi:hypothetical protein
VNRLLDTCEDVEAMLMETVQGTSCEMRHLSPHANTMPDAAFPIELLCTDPSTIMNVRPNEYDRRLMVQLKNVPPEYLSTIKQPEQMHKLLAYLSYHLETCGWTDQFGPTIAMQLLYRGRLPAGRV